MRLYKILPTQLWKSRVDVVPPAPTDVRDGYMHLSTAAQLRETAQKHFAAQTHLSLIVVESDALLAESLRWEISRGGALFPHVYGPLPLSAVTGSSELTGEQAGVFAFPSEIPIGA